MIGRAPIPGSQRVFVVLASLFGLTGVATGAFAAHGLEELVTPDRLEVFETAAEYQMVHAIALLGLACLHGPRAGPWSALSGWLFVAGIVLFSGSLYLLVLSGVVWLGAVTPFGGLTLMSGWLVMGIAAMRGEFSSVRRT